MKEVIYRWWVWFVLALLSHGKIYVRSSLEEDEEGRILPRLSHCLRPLQGLLRCMEPFSFHCTVGPPDMAQLWALGTPPTLLLALRSFGPSLSARQSPSDRLCFLQFPLNPHPLFPGHPIPAGWASRLGTKHFCVATAIWLNAGQHG